MRPRHVVQAPPHDHQLGSISRALPPLLHPLSSVSRFRFQPTDLLSQQAITAGFFYNTSKMSKSGDYKTIKNQHTVYIHPSSVLHKQEVRAGVRVLDL